MSAIKCIKYLLFSFNFVFWLAGLGALGVGVWMYLDPGTLNEFMGKYSFKVPAAILMGAGSIVMLTGFCGCMGAIKESRCLLGSFFFMLLIIFCAEIACGILGFLFRNKVETQIRMETQQVIKEKYGNNDHDIDHVVDTTQKKFECCGADGPQDYSGSTWEKRGLPVYRNMVPSSCCKKKSVNCTRNFISYSSPDVYPDGCVSKIKDYAMKHMLYIGGVAIGVGAIQLLGMIFSLCLFFSIEKL